MFTLIISRKGKPRDFTTLDPNCIAEPPIQLVLLELHWIRLASFQSKYAVHRLLNIDQKEALVVFENGYVSRLHQIHEDSAAGPNRERIVWCEGIHSSSDTYVCVLTQV